MRAVDGEIIGPPAGPDGHAIGQIAGRGRAITDDATRETADPNLARGQAIAGREIKPAQGKLATYVADHLGDERR